MASNKIIVFVFACAAVFQIAYGLDCYSCDRTKCAKPKSEWAQIKDCGKTISPMHVPACVTIAFTDPATKEKYTERKCIQAEQQQPSVKPTFNCPTNALCEICTENFCNSAPTSVNFSLFAMIGVVLAYLVPKYILH